MSSESIAPKPHDSSETKDKIKVPQAEDEIVCCVCFNGDVEDENEIVICSGCDCAVHQGCYGITSVPADDWFCRKCKILNEWEAEGKKTPKPEFQCKFCPHPDGAFSPTEDGKWCHTVCASWIPELGFNDPKTMDYVVGELEDNRKKTKCQLCNVKGGIIQCVHGVCRYACHVMCAWKHKLRMEVREVPPIKDGDPFDVGQIVYCNAHKDEKFDPQKYIERYYREDPEVAAKIAEREKKSGGGKKKRKKHSDDDATDPEEESEEFEEEGSSKKKKKSKSKKKGKKSKKKKDDEDYEEDEEDEEEEEKEPKPTKKEKAEKADKADKASPAADTASASVTAALPVATPSAPVTATSPSGGHKCPNCGSSDINHLCAMKVQVQVKVKAAPRKEEENEEDGKKRKRGRPKKQKTSQREEEDGNDTLQTMAEAAAAANPAALH